MEHSEDFKIQHHIINNLLEYFLYLKFEIAHQVEIIHQYQNQTFLLLSLISTKTTGILHKEQLLTDLFQRIHAKEDES